MKMTDRENDIFWKEYFYPGTDVLINYFDIKNYDQLKEAEATNSFERLLELQEKPLDLDFGKQHLNALHRYIFEDVYPFAGEYRKVNMAKAKGGFLFINHPEDIDHYLDQLFQEVEERLMHCRSKFDFCEILARLYTGIIYCHPYREGNGRTTREFLREFSMAKSKEVGLEEMILDWTKIDKEQLDECVEVAHLFPGQTSIFFSEALIPTSTKNK